MNTPKNPILPIVPTDGKVESLQTYLMEVNKFLADLTSNIRSDIDTVNDSIPEIPEADDGTWSVKSVAADYTILDDDGYDAVMVDTRTGAKTVTLPTLADNLGRQITIMSVYDGGALTVDGDGAETIDGYASFAILNQYGYCTVLATAAGWVALRYQSVFSTGWVNTNDWTDRELGNINLTYDNLTGTFTVGEVVKEYSDTTHATATGVSGVVMSDSGTVLVLMKVAGGGTFTNNYYLKGETSGATAQVNGATKNANTNIYHGLGRNLSDLEYRPYFSTDGTENNTYHMYIAYQSANAETGLVIKQVDTNTLQSQTGEYGGFMYYNSAGNWVSWQTDDYYYNIKLLLQK